MANLRHQQGCVRVVSGATTVIALAAALLTLAFGYAPTAQAQTYNVIFTFTNCFDGGGPTSTLVLDRSGSLYGTAEFGGVPCGDPGGYGVVFRLKRSGSGWLETPLHVFTGGTSDGEAPTNYGGLTVAADGSLYGTTTMGGTANRGTIFRVRPPQRACKTALCPWNEETLHSFIGTPDGDTPFASLTLDAAGNLYGTTNVGGSDLGFGSAFQLSLSGGGWTESTIYDVEFPFSGLTFDADGNLYGVAPIGGEGSGAVFQLTPSGSGWTPHTLYSFSGGDDGNEPIGGVVLDAAGNIYGSTIAGGPTGGGVVFELVRSGGDYSYRSLYTFAGGAGPFNTLTMDAASNLYGTTLGDGAYGGGNVFKLTRSGNSWTYSDLYDFQAGNGGLTPVGGVTIDAQGNLYGTTSAGGAHNAGVVWEITP